MSQMSDINLSNVFIKSKNPLDFKPAKKTLPRPQLSAVPPTPSKISIVYLHLPLNKKFLLLLLQDFGDHLGKLIIRSWGMPRFGPQLSGL